MLHYDLLIEYQDKDNNSGGEFSNRATYTFRGKDALSNFDLFVSKRKKGKTSHVKSESLFGGACVTKKSKL